MRAVDGDAPAEGFGQVDAPGSFIDGGVRFVTPTGRKFLVMEGENPEVYAAAVMAHANQNASAELGKDGLTADPGRNAPATGDIDSAEMVDDSAGIVVLVLKGKDGAEPVRQMFSVQANAEAYSQARAIATWLNDASPEHRDAADGGDATLVQSETPDALPALDDVRGLRFETDANGFTLAFVSTEEGKPLVFSSALTPQNVATLAGYMPALQGIAAAEKDGFALARTTPDSLPQATAVTELTRDAGTGAYRVVMANGDKLLVPPGVDATAALHAHLQQVEAFRASPKAHQSAVATAQSTTGAKLADANTALPAFDQLVGLEVVRQGGETMVAYKVRGDDGGGHAFIASSVLVPELTADLVGLEPAFARMDALGGERPAANAPRPGVDDALGIDVDGATATLTWEQGGTEFELARAANPGLYDDMVKLEAFQGASDAHRDLFAKRAEGREDAVDVTALPRAAALTEWTVEENADGGVITFDERALLPGEEPRKMVVSSVLAPAFYANVKKVLEGLDAVKGFEAQGYRRVSEGDADATIVDVQFAGGFDGTVMLVTMENGGKIVAHAAVDTLFAERAVAWVGRGSQNTIDTLKRKHGLADKTNPDIREADTTVTGEDGKALPVSTVAIKTLYDTYRAQADKGDIDLANQADPKVQFLQLMEVQDALANGRDFLPYFEDTTLAGGAARPNGNSVRKFGHAMESFSPADMRGMVDEQKLDTAFETVMKNPAIAGDYGKALHDALRLAPERDAIADALYAKLTSPHYPAFLAELRGKGFETQAQTIIREDLATLTLIDPERGQEALQLLNAQALVYDVQTQLQLQEQTEQDMLAQGQVDDAYLIAKGLRAFGGVTRHAVNTIDKFIHGFLQNKTSFNALDKVVKEAIRAHPNTDWKKMEPSEFDKKMQNIMDKTYIPMKNREGLAKFLGLLHAHGIWGSITALGGVIGALTLLINNAPSEMGEREQILLAQTIVSTLAVAPHMLNTASLADRALGRMTGNERAETLAHKMGTHKEVPEIWGKKTLLPQSLVEKLPKTLQPAPKVPSDLQNLIDNAGLDFSDTASIRSTPSGASSLSDSIMSDAASTSSGMSRPDIGWKSLGTASRVMAATGDLGFGVLGMVYGALGMKDAIALNDPGIKATSGLVLAGSGATAIGGTIATAALFSTFPLSAIANPFLWGGAIIAGVGLMVEVLIDDWRGNPKLEAITDEQNEWWDTIANLGVLEDDHADKRSYANTLFSTNNGRGNVPYTTSIWDFETQEFGHFTQTPETKGSATTRMDEGLRMS